MAESQQDIDHFEWVGAIVTASGKEFNVLDPQEEMYDLYDIVQSISLICRYNGHIPSFYSVAEHSVRVANWLKVRGATLEEQMAGLLHDAAEAYVGDMVRPLKRVPSVGGKHQELEEVISTHIHKMYGNTLPVHDIVHDADRAVFEWECEFIRTGKTKGMTPDVAALSFASRYAYITEDLHDPRLIDASLALHNALLLGPQGGVRGDA